MNCTKEYKEHIEYTFHAFCKIVIHHAAITAARTAGRKQKHEISLEYLAEEKHYPFATEDEYFKAPEQYEEYPENDDCLCSEPRRTIPKSYGCKTESRSEKGTCGETATTDASGTAHRGP